MWQLLLDPSKANHFDHAEDPRQHNDEVSEALSMHVAPPAIRIVVVPVGVTVLLGIHNPPCSWTGTVGFSLPGFTIAPFVDSLLWYRLISRPKSILQDNPKI
jgi:hypothetical protein